jgi:hypothetical protein
VPAGVLSRCTPRRSGWVTSLEKASNDAVQRHWKLPLRHLSSSSAFGKPVITSMSPCMSP